MRNLLSPDRIKAAPKSPDSPQPDGNTGGRRQRRGGAIQLLWTALMTPMILLNPVQSQAEAPPSSTAVVSLTGDLRIVVLDSFDQGTSTTIRYLSVADGKRYQLESSTPELEAKLAHFSPNERITVTGSFVPTGSDRSDGGSVSNALELPSKLVVKSVTGATEEGGAK